MRGRGREAAQAWWRGSAPLGRGEATSPHRLRTPRRRWHAMLRGGMCSNCYVANRFFPSKDCLVIDIHCHLLPEVDDGPKSWDVAVEMCRMAAADGITHAVATPHANDRYAYDRAYLSGLLGQLRDQLREKLDLALQLQLSLGCDFHLSFENLERVLEQPHTYTIGETNYLLIELSNFSIPAQLENCFFRLGDRGLTPILTHPERNPILQQTPQRIL